MNTGTWLGFAIGFAAAVIVGWLVPLGFFFGFLLDIALPSFGLILGTIVWDSDL